MRDTAKAKSQVRRFNLTIGFSKSQAVWTETMSLTFSELAERYSKCKTSENKDGPCVVPATFSGKKRRAVDVERIDALFLDSDSGHTMEDLIERIEGGGFKAIIHSTFSHMSNTTEVARVRWDNWVEEVGELFTEEFLDETKNLLPNVLKDAALYQTTAANAIFHHQPCPKYRIILPLKTPFEPKAAQGQDEFLAEWKARVKTLVDAWGLTLDQTCFEAARLFFDPRRPAKSAPFEYEVIKDGEFLDIYDIEPSQDAVATATKQSKYEGEAYHGDFDVASWYQRYGTRFDIKELISTKVPELLTSRVSEDRQHMLCPFRDEHTKFADDPASEGDMFIRSPRGDGLAFAAYCSHNSCQKRHTIDFIQGMLAQNWFTPRDLESAAYRLRIADFDPIEDSDLEHLDIKEEEPLPLIDIETWEDNEPPPREWVLDQWIPRGYVTGLYGAGGTGKSLLAQQLMTCMAAGLKFLGIETKPMTVLGVFCEDDIDELHRRQRDINTGLFVEYLDIHERFNIMSRLGEDNLLMVYDKFNEGKRTQFWEDLAELSDRVMPDLIIIDTLSDVFAGGESDRSQVRQFVQSCLGRLAQRANAGVLLLGHPPKVGTEGYSGTTGWDAALRSRLFFERRDDEDTVATAFRYLTKKKANYSTIDDEIRVEYVDGCFSMRHKIDAVHMEEGATFEDLIKAVAIKLWLFIRERNEQRQPMSHSTHAHNSIYKATARSGKFSGVKRHVMERAFQWLVEGKFVTLDAEIYMRANRHWARGVKTEKEPTREDLNSLDDEDILN